MNGILNKTLQKFRKILSRLKLRFKILGIVDESFHLQLFYDTMDNEVGCPATGAKESCHRYCEYANVCHCNVGIICQLIV